MCHLVQFGNCAVTLRTQLPGVASRYTGLRKTCVEILSPGNCEAVCINDNAGDT